MIIKTEHVNELYGCLRIMSKIAYLYDQCKSWDRARSAHFAIISSIEEGEAGWNSSFGHYDLMCVPPLEQKSDQYDHKATATWAKTTQKHDYPSQSMDMQYIQKCGTLLCPVHVCKTRQINPHSQIKAMWKSQVTGGGSDITDAGSLGNYVNILTDFHYNFAIWWVIWPWFRWTWQIWNAQ